MTGVPDATDLLAALTGAAQPDLPPKARLGTVDPAYTALTGYPSAIPGPRVTFDGETTLSVKQYPVVGPYIPAPADRVVLVPVGRTYVVVGALSDVTTVLHSATTLLTAAGIAIPIDGPPRVRARLTGSANAAHDPSFPGTPISWAAPTPVAFDYQSQITFNAAAPTFFTVAVAGVYRVTGAVSYSASNVGLRYAAIVINGTAAAGRIDPAPTALFECNVLVEDELICPVGTTIGLAYLQNSGGTLSLLGGLSGTRLIIRRVSA